MAKDWLLLMCCHATSLYDNSKPDRTWAHCVHNEIMGLGTCLPACLAPACHRANVFSIVPRGDGFLKALEQVECRWRQFLKKALDQIECRSVRDQSLHADRESHNGLEDGRPINFARVAHASN